MSPTTYPSSAQLHANPSRSPARSQRATPIKIPTPTVQRYRPKAAQPLKVIAIGDSLVYGYGDATGGGWVERLRRQWMHPNGSGNVLYNLGIRGDKAEQVAGRLEVEFQSRGELRHRTPDRLIISVGTNDSPRVGRSQGKNITPPNQFQDTMTTLLDRARSLCPVYFVGMVPVVPARMPFMDCLYYNHADQFDYKEMTRQLCIQRDIPYLDIFDLWMGRGAQWLEHHMGPDGLHPNDAGYEILWRDINGWDPVATLSLPL